MLKTKSKSARLKFIIIIFLVFAINSCNKPVVPPQQDKISASYITANSFRELIKSVDYIVIGELIAARDNINIARDDKDISKPSSTRYEIGQIYEVKVDKYIKGDGLLTINVIQVEGFLSQKDPKTSASIQKARENFDFIPIEPGKKYLMFLSDLYGFPKGEYYIGSIHPWRFDISDPERVVPESPWEYANQVFPPVPLKLILEQIHHPELDIIPEVKLGAYPAPDNTMLEETGNPYPPPAVTP